MPGFNRKGPAGAGAASGRGRGGCNPARRGRNNVGSQERTDLDTPFQQGGGRGLRQNQRKRDGSGKGRFVWKSLVTGANACDHWKGSVCSPLRKVEMWVCHSCFTSHWRMSIYCRAVISAHSICSSLLLLLYPGDVPAFDSDDMGDTVVLMICFHL